MNQRLSVVEECLYAVNFLSGGLVGVLVRNSCGSSPDNMVIRYEASSVTNGR